MSACGGSDESGSSQRVPSWVDDCAVSVAPSPALPDDVARLGPEWIGEGQLFVAAQSPEYGGSLDPATGDIVMKIGWFLRRPGELIVRTRQLDGDGGPSETRVPSSRFTHGPLPSSIRFPHAGCWEIRGVLGSDAVSITVAVFDTPR